MGSGMGAKGPDKSEVHYLLLELLPPHPLLCLPKLVHARSLPVPPLTSQQEGGAWLWLSYLSHAPQHARAATWQWPVGNRAPSEPASPPGAVFAEAPFQDGYDLTIGTSERGSDVASAQLPNFRWVQPGEEERSRGQDWWGQSYTDRASAHMGG